MKPLPSPEPSAPAFPAPAVRLARLAGAVGLSSGWPPTEDSLQDLAERTGLRPHDLLLAVNLPLPETAWHFDAMAGASTSLVVRCLGLPAHRRQLLCDRARSMTVAPELLVPLQRRPYEQYPPGFGSLLVRMLELRNLNWSRAAKAMCLVSGVCKAAATIGAVGRGAKPLDAELLQGFAAILGVPVAVLAALTGHPAPVAPRTLAPEELDTASLVWEVRHLTADQMGSLTAYAEALGGA
ncbi:hypothetical protein ACQKM2_06775 [Streptomyces sp. NPDC004126]|uniref:hypothetical protein n=1 Tax=Streptomyces sp. NPDC004126 TaxID=3390695 RepID=UPI003CFCB9F9